MEMSGQLRDPAALFPKKQPLYPLDSGTQQPVGRGNDDEKVPDPTGYHTPVVHPVTSQYTDWAIRTHDDTDLFLIYTNPF